eukprot:TRINITY_DN4907_c0_g1_i2.p1 TRINITY_DN4907_c0_g1~~TRINITY_DN4907_c0_g1_i2.p1  ORF type:complete len:885 (+),score=110.90 TRINITY_DN4907_c0_g1_i2:50-2704(+)
MSLVFFLAIVFVLAGVCYGDLYTPRAKALQCDVYFSKTTCMATSGCTWIGEGQRCVPELESGISNEVAPSLLPRDSNYPAASSSRRSNRFVVGLESYDWSGTYSRTLCASQQCFSLFDTRYSVLIRSGTVYMTPQSQVIVSLQQPWNAYSSDLLGNGSFSLSGGDFQATGQFSFNTSAILDLQVEAVGDSFSASFSCVSGPCAPIGAPAGLKSNVYGTFEVNYCSCAIRLCDFLPRQFVMLQSLNGLIGELELHGTEFYGNMDANQFVQAVMSGSHGVEEVDAGCQALWSPYTQSFSFNCMVNKPNDFSPLVAERAFCSFDLSCVAGTCGTRFTPAPLPPATASVSGYWMRTECATNFSESASDQPFVTCASSDALYQFVQTGNQVWLIPQTDVFSPDVPLAHLAATGTINGTSLALSSDVASCTGRVEIRPGGADRFTIACEASENSGFTASYVCIAGGCNALPRPDPLQVAGDFLMENCFCTPGFTDGASICNYTRNNNVVRVTQSGQVLSLATAGRAVHGTLQGVYGYFTSFGYEPVDPQGGPLSPEIGFSITGTYHPASRRGSVNINVGNFLRLPGGSTAGGFCSTDVICVAGPCLNSTPSAPSPAGSQISGTYGRLACQCGSLCAELSSTVMYVVQNDTKVFFSSGPIIGMYTGTLSSNGELRLNEGNCNGLWNSTSNRIDVQCALGQVPQCRFSYVCTAGACLSLAQPSPEAFMNISGQFNVLAAPCSAGGSFPLSSMLLDILQMTTSNNSAMLFIRSGQLSLGGQITRAGYLTFSGTNEAQAFACNGVWVPTTSDSGLSLNCQIMSGSSSHSCSAMLVRSAAVSGVNAGLVVGVVLCAAVVLAGALGLIVIASRKRRGANADKEVLVAEEKVDNARL